MQRSIRRILIANRGEIAIRIMRTCREMGIESVAVYSDADRGALHVQHADRAERVGAARASESYLSVEAIVDAARRSGADAVHPGYGFLSEDARLARAVERAGIVFIGPPAETLEGLGNKLSARRAAVAAGVPVVPGLLMPFDGAATDLDEIGFPMLLKAAAGGGGRGMRRVESRAALEAAAQLAAAEASAAFGDGTLYAERVISPARHVEVQLLGDRHGNVGCLGERDCSVQRRHQKLVEETPSPGVDGRLREALFESALRMARSVPFHSAATAEFLVDAGGRHYFLELNARLQVEHGVTELVTGLDLVALQIRVAAGERLPPEVLSATPRGHAIEVRLYAEDPYDDFRPAPGTVTAWRMPGGPGVRVDAGVEADTTLPAEYDPLLAKLLVHAADRPAALARLRRALDETLIGGVQTDQPFSAWLVSDQAFAEGAYDTSLVPDRWRGGSPLLDSERALAGLAAVHARRTAPAARTVGPAPASSGWLRAARDVALRQ